MDSGVAFPGTDGRRSTTAAGRAILADALTGVDPALAATVSAEPDWRRGYLRHFRDLTVREATTPGGAATIAAAGLDSVARRFVLHRDGQDRPLAEAVRSGLDAASRDPALHTVTVAGRREPAPAALSLPYRGTRLVGDSLDLRLDSWLDRGIVEDSFVAAVREVVAHPEWLDLRGRTVVLLGAGAEMGPLVSLLRWGAHVVAVDLPGPAMWRRILAVARDSPGSVSVPVSRWLPASAAADEIAEAAGVDVVARAPELLGWLAAVEPPYTFGSYVYADGAAHVRATVAVDAVLRELLRLHGTGISLAFLATPTDVFCVPEAVVLDSRRRYAARGRLRRTARLAGRWGSAGALFRPHYGPMLTLPDGRRAGLSDSLLPQQGPNYALAKRIQRWRAVHERVGGRPVSVPIVAATRTRSVVRNRLLAAGYAGAHRFGVEIFDPSTSSTFLAALLARDLATPQADPAAPGGHPADLFWSAANHGGLWRSPYEPRSVLGIAVLLGMIRRGA